MRLPEQATLCPLRKAKFLGRALFRHSATLQNHTAQQVREVFEVDACE